jgi:Tol biopolymer transport system component
LCAVWLGAVALGCAGTAAAREPRTIHVGFRPQVFLVAREGGARRLTGGETPHYAAVWSRAGKRIAMGAGSDVAIVSLDGHVRQAIRGAGGYVGPVAWSPDDRRIAFVAYHPVGQTHEGDLVVADLDGRHRRVLAHHAYGQPDWSRDGSTVFYKQAPHHSYDARALWAVPSRGGRPRRLATEVQTESRVLTSPDGAWVLVLRSFTDRRTGLWVVRTDGGGLRRVFTGQRFLPRSYGWAPDGSGVFGGKRERTHPIVTALSRRQHILGASFYSAQYDWSSRGWLAWVKPTNGPTEVRSSRTDGSLERVLARFTSKHGFEVPERMSWAPDGQHLVIEIWRDFD